MPQTATHIPTTNRLALNPPKPSKMSIDLIQKKLNIIHSLIFIRFMIYNPVVWTQRLRPGWNNGVMDLKEFLTI